MKHLLSFMLLLIIPSIVSAQPCNTGADSDCNGKVNMTELYGYMNVWYSCSSCAPDLLGVITAYYEKACDNDPGCTAAGRFCDGTMPFNCSIGGEGCLVRSNGTPCRSGYSCSSGACAESSPCEENCTLRGPGFACNASGQCEWVPPIGIPKPSFGIEESYLMYNDSANRNPNLTYTANAEGGFYTHYIDNTHPDANDTANPYGTEQRPRMTIPRGLPPGSVAEVHNGASANGWGNFNAVGVGTAAQPIFIRGIDMPRVPFRMNIGYRGNTSYLIVEGISFFAGSIYGREQGAFNTSYVAARNCDFHGNESAGGVGIGSYRPPNIVHYVVFYNNTVHDNGIWNPDNATGDRDIGGVTVVQYSNHVWIIDSEMYHNEYDGVQIDGDRTPRHIDHIYVGRNTAHHNKQYGFWSKSADDVIFSQNIVYQNRASSSASGGGMGLQYHAHRVWFLFNEVYECTMGFYGPSAENDVSAYVIGNVIHDLLPWPGPGEVYNPEDAYSLAAITWYGYLDRHIIGNTIYNVPAGIYGASNAGQYIMAGNIIYNVTEGKHILLSNPPAGSALENNLFYQPNGSVAVKWGQYLETGDMDEFRSRTSTGGGCMVADPNFENPAENGFRLQQNSPAIDKAVESDVYQIFYDLYGIDIRKDMDGKTRPIDGDNDTTAAWDIGAYEFG